jgi:amino acid transporter
VSPRFRTPWVAVAAFVVPSLAIGVVSTVFTSPATASGFLSTFGLVIMYLVVNVALLIQWVKLRRKGIQKNPLAWVVVPLIGVCVLAVPVWGDLRPGQAGGSYCWLPCGRRPARDSTACSMPTPSRSTSSMYSRPATI